VKPRQNVDVGIDPRVEDPMNERAAGFAEKSPLNQDVNGEGNHMLAQYQNSRRTISARSRMNGRLRKKQLLVNWKRDGSPSLEDLLRLPLCIPRN